MVVVVVRGSIKGGFIVCVDGRGCFGINNVIFVAFNIDGIGG